MLSDDFFHVWHGDLLAFPRHILDTCLTWEDRARAAGFRREEDRMRSLASRAALRHLCAGYLGAEPRSLVFAASEGVKPRLGASHLVSGLKFNLSHSGRHVLLAFARDVEVGVDVELIAPIADLRMLIASVTHPDEEASLSAEPDERARLRRFLALWTAKEAVLKAIGTGLGADPRTARFAADGAGWAFQRNTDSALDEPLVVWRADPSPDAVGHVAVLGEAIVPALFRLIA
ncbi:4'-phosphopantetheinyl transferase superfamily protein [Nostoc sp. NIES-2111]